LLAYHIYDVTIGLNVLYTMAVACTGMELIDKHGRGILSWAVFVFMMVLCGINCDYSVFGILLILLFYGLRDKGLVCQSCIGIVWSFVIYYVFSDSIAYFIGGLTGSFLLLSYDRKKGPGPKWYRNIFYWFYPVHMLVLWIFSYMPRLL
jgi:hypothetical protein